MRKDFLRKGGGSYFKRYLDVLEKEHLYPTIREIDGFSFNPLIKIKGREYLSFTSNNYLGLADNAEVKSFVKAAIDEYGIGSGSTRLLAGSLDVQIKLERALASFFGTQDAITFSSGYLANVGVIRMLVDSFPYFQIEKEEEGVIFSDELNHASIIDGVRLSKAKRVKYGHSNIDELSQHLNAHRHVERKLILTDGVFSMDGDLARLPEIVVLAREHNALLMVDDSHGVGVLGPHGEGTPAHFGVSTNVDVLMGSFTKAFGSLGGFVCINNELGKYLRITARSFIFSDPIPPAFVAGLIKTTELIKEGDHLRKNAIENADYLRKELKTAGFRVHGECATIVPLIVGDERKAILFSEKLVDRNILAPCIRRPAVEEGRERLRFSIMATHKKEHIDRLIEACVFIGKEVCLI